MAAADLIVDVHHHFMPAVLFDRLAAQAGGKRIVTNEISLTLNPSRKDLEAHLKTMDDSGVTVSILTDQVQVMGADVAKARAVAKHVVPRGRRATAALDRPRAEVHVGNCPRAVLARRLPAPRGDEAIGDKRWSGDDGCIGMNAKRTARTDCGDPHAIGCIVDCQHGDASLDRVALCEVTHERRVAVGPRHDRLRVDIRR